MTVHKLVEKDQHTENSRFSSSKHDFNINHAFLVPVHVFLFLCFRTFVHALWADERDFCAVSGSTWSILGSQQEPNTSTRPPGGGPLA